MEKKVKPKKKKRFCDPAVCQNCIYICEGDFICDKKPVPVMVISDWKQTDDYLWCMAGICNEETHKREQKPEPFITIECETEEDFEFIGTAVAFYKKHLEEQEKPQTNGDRIRAMSDEELTDAWIRDNTICRRCAYWDECECDEFVTNEKCREGILEWHKQPVEEVNE